MDLQDKSFGTTLKKARKEKKLTQPQLAELLEISTSYLKDLENFQRNPSHDMFKRITRYLNLSADAIIYPKEEQPDSIYDKMEHIFDLCDAGQRELILALAETVLTQSEDKE